LLVPPTLAVNCCDCPAARLTWTGEIATATVDGRLTTCTRADPDCEPSAKLVAVISTDPVGGTTEGAVYKPVSEMSPTLAIPPGTPPANHCTPVSDVPVTVAVKCWPRPV